MSLIAFEIHAFRNGRWQIDSVFDDRELALYEAKRMDAAGRFSGIRVIEEVYDEQSQNTTTRTIYRGSKVANSNADALERSKKNRKEIAVARQRKAQEEVLRTKQVAAAQARKQSNPVRLIALFSSITLFGIVLLIGLQIVSERF